MTMNDSKEELITWLRDAHAMESNIIKMLEKQSKHLDDWPQMRQRIDSHLAESRRHAERVETCLKDLGSDTSALKEGMAKFSGMMGQTGMGAANDEPVKICIGNYAIEHFEIASYRSLKAAAENCGETQIATVAEEILREEEAMADYLDSHLGEVTQEHLQRLAHA